MKKLLLLLFTLSLFLLSCGKSGEDVKNAVSKKAYTVDFNANGGTTVSAITVEEGKTITEPMTPTKTGFTFEGWYKESGLTNKWNFATDVVNADVTLYAKWLNLVFVEKGTAGTINITESFYIQKYEVTQAQFEAIMGYNPSYFTGKPNNPVEKVTWYDAVMYANKLSEAEGLSPYYTITVATKDGGRITSAAVTENTSADGYRLPTKEEWEYAARGGNKSNNYTCAGSNTIGDVAWTLENNTTNGETNGTKAVGRKQANELGIFDMSGNVQEWTNSLWSTGNRVICGGSWDTNAANAAFASMSNGSPYDYGDHLGFRLVRSF